MYKTAGTIQYQSWKGNIAFLLNVVQVGVLRLFPMQKKHNLNPLKHLTLLQRDKEEVCSRTITKQQKLDFNCGQQVTKEPITNEACGCMCW